MTVQSEKLNSLFDEALKYHSSGDLDGALNLYKKILNYDENNEAALNNIAAIYVVKEKYDKAIEIFNKLIKQNPKNTDAYFNLGKCYMFKEDYVNAIRVFEMANKFSPNDFQILLNLAYSYKYTGDFDNALLNYKHLLNFSNDLNILYEIAEIYYLMGNYDRAIEYCLKILNKDKKNWKAKGLLADSFFNIDKKEDAIYLMRELIDEYPDRNELREKLAEYFLEIGNFDEALYQYETILSKEPNNLDYLRTYKKLKEMINRTGDLKKEMEFTYEEKLKLKAKKYFEQEKYEELIKDFTKELMNNSNNAFLIKNIARAYFKSGKLNEALDYYERYIKLYEDDEILTEYATLLNGVGKYLESHNVIKKIKNLTADIVLIEADNLKNMGLIQEAVSFLEKKSSNFQDYRIYVNLGKYYLEAGNLNSAINVWIKGTKIFPEKKIFNRLLADLYYSNKDYKNALKYMKKYVENDATLAELEFLSKLYLLVKKPKNAFEIWSVIVDKNPKNEEDILVKAKILLYMERIDEALKQVEIIKENKNSEYFYIKGLAFLLLEDYNKAIENFEKSEKLDKEKFEDEFFFVVKYLDRNKLKKLSDKWRKYGYEILSDR